MKSKSAVRASRWVENDRRASSSHSRGAKKLSALAFSSQSPTEPIEEAAARSQAAVDRGDEVVVGVNKYRARGVETTSTSATSTTPRSANSNWRGSNRCRPTRDDEAGKAALDRPARGRRGDGNLLELSIEAAQARATVGEISDALEEVFGRHRATIRSISGVYGAAYEGDEGYAAIRAASRRSPRPRAAGRGCWS